MRPRITQDRIPVKVNLIVEGWKRQLKIERQFRKEFREKKRELIKYIMEEKQVSMKEALFIHNVRKHGILSSLGVKGYEQLV